MNIHPPLASYSPYRDLFPVEATAVETDEGGKLLYTWVEQQLASDGTYADADSPRRGDADNNPLVEINNQSVSVPFFAWARLRGGKSSGQLVFEFQAGGSFAVARCTGRASGDNYYPGALVTIDSEGGTEDVGPCLLSSVQAGPPLLPGVHYHCAPIGTSDGLPLYGVVSPRPDRLKAQLVVKSYDGCPRYKAIRVNDTDTCGEGLAQALTGPDLGEVSHQRNEDLPTYPAPSPLLSSPASAESDDGAGGVPWEFPARALGDSDGAYATCELQPGESTERLLLADMGFVLPEDVGGDPVAITNVSWDVDVAASGTDVNESEVKLAVDGVVTGTSKHTATDLDDEDETRTYAGDLSSWGVSGSLTPADTNSPTYGLSLRYTNNAAASGDDDGVRTVRVGYADNTLAFDPAGGWAPHSIHELFPANAAGAFYVASSPWVDLFRPAGVVDDDGAAAHHRRYPDDMDPEDGEEVRLIAAD